MTEEQLEDIGDHDELALFAKKIKHISNNRKEGWRSKNSCFECGRAGHFAADCPSKERESMTPKRTSPSPSTRRRRTTRRETLRRRRSTQRSTASSAPSPPP